MNLYETIASEFADDEEFAAAQNRGNELAASIGLADLDDQTGSRVFLLAAAARIDDGVKAGISREQIIENLHFGIDLL